MAVGFVRLALTGILGLAAMPSVPMAQDDGDRAGVMAAAVAAVVRSLPPDVIRDNRVDPNQVADAVLDAVPVYAWRPIETAPKDAEGILLGRLVGSEFMTAVGFWQVMDEADRPGAWTTEDWWGGLPTHWAPLPPVPRSSE